MMDECLISHVNSCYTSFFLLLAFDVFADAGVVGDYHNARILVRDNPDGFVTGLVGSEWNYINDGEVLNVTADGIFAILLVTAWPSRIVFVDVVSGIDNVLPEFNPR